MKKHFILLLIICCSMLKTFADEGMWLPLLLGKEMYSNMQKKGLKLTKEQLYSINQPCLKDAVVIFGRGCTGVVVSNDGLIFTNHHCGFDAIATASTVEHNYLKDGFFSTSKSEEISADNLQVRFLVRIEDISSKILAELGNLKGKERMKKENEVLAKITLENSNKIKSLEARSLPFFHHNQYFLFVYQAYNDVRLVAAPPESMGKFGGETDNWTWPRHNCDFAVFRVYTAPDGSPASYDKKNIPLKPKWVVPVSLNGIQNNDFAMIWGYPGGTNRLETSYGVKLATEINNPTLVELRGIRLGFMKQEMVKDPAVKLQLASTYAQISNYWKFFDGETKGLLKYNIFEEKKKAENKFQELTKNNSEYNNIFERWQEVYNKWTPYAKLRVVINEGILGSPLLAFAQRLNALLLELKTGNNDTAKIRNLAGAINEQRTTFLNKENIVSDKKIVAAVCEYYKNNLPESQYPKGFYENLVQQYNTTNCKDVYTQLAENIFDNTMILKDDAWKNFMQSPTIDAIEKDAAFQYVFTFMNNYTKNFVDYFNSFNDANDELFRLYDKATLELNKKNGKQIYPDANFTMRLSYGNVKNYTPRNGVLYDYTTTAKGILEKYVPNDYEFNLPNKAVKLLQNNDFGRYADKSRNTLVTDFITTNDITGGNSGSPILNNKGELIGLAFDGNYESLCHKIYFDKDLNRTICVDVRYMLWVLDKFGEAKNIISELNIK